MVGTEDLTEDLPPHKILGVQYSTVSYKCYVVISRNYLLYASAVLHPLTILPSPSPWHSLFYSLLL